MRTHDSAKLTFWLLKRVGDGRGDGKAWKRVEVRGGVHRNNFTVVVTGDGEERTGEDEGREGDVGMEVDADEEWGGIEEKPVEEAEAEDEEWGGIEEGGEEEEWSGIQ